MTNTDTSKNVNKDVQEGNADHAERVALALYRVAQGIEALMRKEGQRQGLSRTGVEALLFLSNAHPRSRTIGLIARRLSVTPATATRLVDALERRGLVRRVRPGGDRRTVRVELTAMGRRVAAQVAAVRAELARLVRPLPEEQQRALADGLTAILRAMQKAGYVSASWVCRTCPFFRPEAYPGAAKPHLCTLTGERLSEEESYLERLERVSAQVGCPD